MSRGAPRTRPCRIQLGFEFALFYLATPVAIALFLPPRHLFSALFFFTLVGLVLLAATGGFAWRRLIQGWDRIPWFEAVLIAALLLGGGLLVLTFVQPSARLAILRERPGFMVLIAVIYPILSALPQELIFRVLFFHRYSALLPSGRAALAVNAAAFSLAHLMYWSPLVLAVTFVGGWLFARAYLTRGFPAAWVLHAVAGDVIFAAGLGIWFYSGNAVRPF